ncbi:MAG: 2-oxoglutarate and iron-dependent oxygenase domain-containing protein [Pseudomonadota bacterium]
MQADTTLEIPLVDLNRWQLGSDAERAAVVKDVDAYLQKLGFLMVSNHGIEPAVRDAARHAAHRFFALNASIKQAYACPPDAYRGWIGPGLESNASSYSESSEGDADVLIDLKEAYSVGPAFAAVEDYRKRAPRWYAPNIWPDEVVPGFSQALTAWLHAADRCTLILLDILCSALGLEDGWVSAHCRHPMATVTANLYPEVRQAGGWRVGAHTDFGTITLLDRDTDNGLQVEVAPGQWIEAPRLENALTVNLGEMMVLLSGGRWRANPHRVAARAGAAANLSLIYFHDPDYDLELPAQHDDGRPVTAADFLGAKMDQIIQSPDASA